jgi:acetyl-CoA acetyltransferase
VTEAVIVSTARTPIGRARKGSLAGVDAFALAEVAVSAALERSGIPVDDIDDLILAESYQGGGVIGRNVAVRLGMPQVPGQRTAVTAGAETGFQSGGSSQVAAAQRHRFGR